MKILVIGLGSMGKRRVRNLLKLRYNDIIGFDTKEGRCKETSKKYHIDTFSKIDEALKNNPDALIISTPPNFHRHYAEIAIKNNLHFFMELNHSYKDVEKIIKKIKKKKIIAASSCTMLYHPIIKKLKKLIDENKIGRPLHVYHHFGHYLPFWHPWENYKDFFVSNKETGGAKELVPFELVWMIGLFSKIKRVSGHVTKLSDLDVDIDDIYQIQLEFEKGITCSLILDVFSIPSTRETKISGTKGTITCDFNSGIIKIDTIKKSKTISVNIGKKAKNYSKNTPSDSIYEEEIKNYLLSIKNNKKYPFPLENELQILKILDAIEKSSQRKKSILIKK